MSKLGVVEDTLFVPMLGRIYASEHYPQILYDKKALELKKKLPSDLVIVHPGDGTAELFHLSDVADVFDIRHSMVQIVQKTCK